MRFDFAELAPAERYKLLGGLVVPRPIALVTTRDKDGRATEIVFDLVDYYDPATGFTAMQRTTGFSAAIVLERLAHGQVPLKGAAPLEKSIPGSVFLEEIRKRGVNVKQSMRSL